MFQQDRKYIMNVKPVATFADHQIGEPWQFHAEVIAGLSQAQKQLPSKYFYDAAGDRLFQEIMASPDYYLTRCEMDIFTAQTARLVDAISQSDAPFNLIELGPGDCTKSIHLLRALLQENVPFTYIPIDISENVISNLKAALPAALPNIKLAGMNGDYFEMLDELTAQEGRNIVLCLGANIGNMSVKDCSAFCCHLRSYLSPGDMAVVGFDLKKDPRIIQAAYDDRDGITRQFNLNLLKRMNRELSADFEVDAFEHYAHYDPITGASKSYLVSLKKADVHFPGKTISFAKDECIWMEISQKFTLAQIDDLAHDNGFKPVDQVMDSKAWFTDTVWLAI